jgi:hypothetical protein
MKYEMKSTNIPQTNQIKVPAVSLGGLLKANPVETEQLYQWIKTGIQNKQNGK